MISFSPIQAPSPSSAEFQSVMTLLAVASDPAATKERLSSITAAWDTAKQEFDTHCATRESEISQREIVVKAGEDRIILALEHAERLKTKLELSLFAMGVAR